MIEAVYFDGATYKPVRIIQSFPSLGDTLVWLDGKVVTVRTSQIKLTNCVDGSGSDKAFSGSPKI